MPKKRKPIKKVKLPPLGTGLAKKGANIIISRKKRQAEILKKLGF